MNVLLFGGKGHCGKHIYRQLINRSRNNIKLITRDEVREILGYNKKLYLNDKSIVINCAGVVGKRNSEKDIVETNGINSELPKRLAKMCEETGAKMIHISTQSVFDASAEILDYREQQQSQILFMVFQRLKEQEIRKYGDRFKWCILRTPFHYSTEINNPRNLLTGLIQSALENNKIIVSRNEIFSCCSCKDIAKRVEMIIKEGMRENIEHVAEEKKWKWEEIAVEIKNNLNKKITVLYDEKYLKSNQINSTLEGSQKKCTENLYATIRKILRRL